MIMLALILWICQFMLNASVENNIAYGGFNNQLAYQVSHVNGEKLRRY